jgi:hypothetical protein
MQGAEERRVRRIEPYAADDALMVDQGIVKILDIRDKLSYSSERTTNAPDRNRLIENRSPFIGKRDGRAHSP